MIPVLYDKNEKEYKTNGIGRLICESCEVDEVLNGKFELNMDLPITCKHFKDVQLDMQILATCEMDTQPQPFRIYDIKKKSTGIYQIKAEHISYWLNHIPVSPPSAQKMKIEHPSTVLGYIATRSLEPNPFKFSWDPQMAEVTVESKMEDSQFEFTTPKTARSLLGDDDKSGILGVFKTGEYKFDRYNVHLYQRRGRSTNVSIRYGKNIQTLDQDESIENTVTGVYVYYRKETTTYSNSSSSDSGGSSVPHSGVYTDRAPKRSAPIVKRAAVTSSSSDSGITEVSYVSAGPLHSDNYKMFSYPRTEIVDASSVWDHVPSKTEMNEYMKAWADAKMLGVPELNLDIDFVSLWQKKEYAMIRDLEKLHLGDSVQVIFPAIDVYANGEITEYTWDVLGDCYTKFVIGNSVNIADTIVDYTKAKAKKDVEYIAQKTSQSSSKEAYTASIEHSKLYVDEEVEKIDKNFKESFHTVEEKYSSIEKSDSEIKATVEEHKKQIGDLTGKQKEIESHVSEISQRADQIESSVSSYSNRLATAENEVDIVQRDMSTITQRADSIESTVSQKVTKGDVIKDINSTIQQTASSVKIKADAIDFTGKLTQTGSVTLDSTKGNVELHLRKPMKIEGNIHMDARPTIGNENSEVLVRADLAGIKGGGGDSSLTVDQVYLWQNNGDSSQFRYETETGYQKHMGGTGWRKVRKAFKCIAGGEDSNYGS